MMTKLFKLKFLTPVHFGTNRPGFEDIDNILHSDTLFSAIINNWLRFYPEDMERFFPVDSGKEVTFPWFKISSAFPYYDEILFFPKPYIKPIFDNQEADNNPKVSKKWKKIEFVDQDIFQNIVAKKAISFDEDTTVVGDNFLTLQPKDSLSTIYKQYDTPRVVKDRRSQQTTPFTFTRMQFVNKGGLFFLASFEKAEWEKKFRAVLNLLGDYGIGGDRSVGHGLFEVTSVEEYAVSSGQDAGQFVTLSLFHPSQRELAGILAQSAYQLIDRKGWIFSGTSKPLRRQTVRMFREGSVFSGAKENYGNVVNVLDKETAPGIDHDVFRYGIALTLPVSTEGGNHEAQ